MSVEATRSVTEQRRPGDTLAARVATELRIELNRQRRSGEAVAVELGKSKNWLYNRLNGRIETSLGDLELVCQALDLPVAVLMARSVGAR